jgi:ABC-type amino acid transport system permease subunit
VIRNVPVLLQLFFWYFAVLKSLPEPGRGAHSGRDLNVAALPAGTCARARFRTVALGPDRRAVHRRYFRAGGDAPQPAFPCCGPRWR